MPPADFVGTLNREDALILVGLVHPAYNPYTFQLVFFQPEQYFTLTTNQLTVFFSHLSA
jgi:hypothetical protein